MSLVDTATGEILDALSVDERRELEAAERTIGRGLTAFVQVGCALAMVRDQRLYREQFGTFEAYCQQQWKLGRSRAYEFIDAARVTLEMSAMADTPAPEPMSAIADTPVPQNIGQARALVGLPTPEAAEVMRETADRGPVTARTIRETRTEREERRASPPLTQEQRDHRDAVRRNVNRIENFLHGFDCAAHLAQSPMRDDVLAALDPFDRERFLRIEQETSWPSTMI